MNSRQDERRHEHPAEKIKLERTKLLEIQRYMNISNPLNYRELKNDIRNVFCFKKLLVVQRNISELQPVK